MIMQIFMAGQLMLLYFDVIFSNLCRNVVCFIICVQRFFYEDRYVFERFMESYLVRFVYLALFI